MIRAAGLRVAYGALLLPLAAASDPLDGRTAGPPLDCIDAAASGPMVVDNHAIQYGHGRTLYRTTIADCPALRPMTTLIIEVQGSRLCRNDRFRVLEPNAIIPSAYCRFGGFVPYRRVTARSG